MAQMQVADIVIVGGGPSGAATALSLAREGLVVSLLERTRYDEVRIGETVAPAIRRPLGELGVWEDFLAANHNPSHANRSAWGTPEIEYQDFIFSPYQMGWHLDRRQFDRMLADAAKERGARVITGTRMISVCQTADGWEVEGQCADQTISVKASYLVDATGRSSTIARKLGHRRLSHDRLIGLVGFLTPDSDAVQTDNNLLLEAVEDGWWYSVPLHDGRMVAVYMTDSDLLQSADSDGVEFWSHQLQSTRHTRQRLRGYRAPTQVIIRSANSSILEQPSGPGFIAVGDAAMAFDPLSSQGIYKALLSGIRAAEAIIADRAGRKEAFDEYADELRKEFDEYLELRAAYYRMEVRWPDSVFWQQRQRIDPKRVRITLDPMQEIHFKKDANTRSNIEKLERIFPFPVFGELCELCMIPLPAHQVISAYKHSHGDAIDDQSIIVALQLLIENSIVK